MSRLDQALLKQRQIDRELTAVQRARETAAVRINKSLEKGSTDSLPYKATVMKKMMRITDEVIEEIMGKKSTSKIIACKTIITELRKELDVSIIVCDHLLASLARESMPLESVGKELGKKLMMAYQMAILIRDNKYYYEEMTRFLDSNRVGSFEGIYQRFIAGANIDADRMKIDTSIVKVLGMAIIQLICEHPETYLFKAYEYVTRTRRTALICLDCELYELMDDIVENSISNAFSRIPMVCPPRDWKKQGKSYIGGFMTPFIADNTPIQSGDPNREVPDIPEIYLNTLNKLQKTEWKVNSFMYGVITKIFQENMEIGKIPRSSQILLEDIPESLRGCEKDDPLFKELMEKRRKTHIDNVKIFSRGVGLLTALGQCKELLNDKFHFVYCLDYRGRMYCMSNGLTTQGADYIKSLISFANPKEVGERGLYWLKVRAANLLGYDKVLLDDRVKYIDKLIEEGYMERVASDPIGNSDLWSKPDYFEGAVRKVEKPLQFLATIHELATAYRLKDPTKHLSCLPVGLDGACNGSQHLSVLSFNESLAKAVNVLPSESANDLYQEVADDIFRHMTSQETYNKLIEKHDPELVKTTINWLMGTFDIPPRDMTKRSVMTLVYGSTFNGRMTFVRAFLEEFVKKGDPVVTQHKNKMTVIITTMMDISLMEVSGEAMKALEFIQKVAVENAKKEGTWVYHTALGLKVDNFIPIESLRKVTLLNYKIRVKERSDRPNIGKIKACSAPNYIHSMDACHLIKTIQESGLSDFMAIHDDIGTHACDTDLLYKTVREQFIDLYIDKDYFSTFDTKNTFKRGEPFDLLQVLDSQFFFS